MLRMQGADIGLPCQFAAAESSTGGYGIRTYTVGVGVLNDPGVVQLPQSSAGGCKHPPLQVTKERFPTLSA